MNLVAIDARGNHTAFTTETERQITYVFQTDDMNEYETRNRVVVPLA